MEEYEEEAPYIERRTKETMRKVERYLEKASVELRNVIMDFEETGYGFHAFALRLVLDRIEALRRYIKRGLEET